MDLEFEPKKDVANRRKHGVSLMAAEDIDLDRATIIEDRRADCGERRYIAFARLNDRLHCLWFTWRGGQDPRHWTEKGQRTRKETL